MEQPEQNVVAQPTPQTELPKPAALQDTRPTDVARRTGAAVFDAKNISIYYGSFRAVTDVSLTIHENEITAFIGPSGCGKTTVLRTLNRLNDLIPGARVEGEVHYRGASLYGHGVSPIAVRRRIGMVFQKPNPFPKSIYDNVAYGPRINGIRNKGKLDEIVERSLRQAALWDEVKNRLKQVGPGPVRRAGAAALHRPHARRRAGRRPDGRARLGPRPDRHRQDRGPDARDQVAVHDRHRHAQHAAGHPGQRPHRLLLRPASTRRTTPRTGTLVEYGPTQQIFEDPQDPRTQAYVTGRMG